MADGHESWLKRRKWLVISIAAAVLLLIVFSTKIALYANFLLGNDIVVKLEAGREFLSMVHGEKEPVSFEASITTNPFCAATCTSEFTDISSNTVIEKDEFELKPGFPLHKNYVVDPVRLGTGQELYRFSMECRSLATVLCHTKGEPTTRSILVVVSYGLTEEEKALKEELKNQLSFFVQRLSELDAKQKDFESTFGSLSEKVMADELKIGLDKVNSTLSSQIAKMLRLQDLWMEQDYYTLAEQIEMIGGEINTTQAKFDAFSEKLSKDASLYNALIDGLTAVKFQLEELRLLYALNMTDAPEIGDEISQFNDAVTLFTKKNTMDAKTIAVSDIRKITEELWLMENDKLKKETLRRELELDIAHDALCYLGGTCIVHPAIKDRANQSIFHLQETCAAAAELNRLYDAINDSMHDAFEKENYPVTEAFSTNIRLKVNNLRQNISAAYIARLPQNSSNSALIASLISPQPQAETEQYTDYNLAVAMVVELASQKTTSCDVGNSTIKEISGIPFEKIAIQHNAVLPLNITFDEPLPQCCVYGKCEPCCLTEECRGEDTYPVVFLHGHAFNKDVSAEYSLEAFNKIQKRLEDDGYLNAGAISLYSDEAAEDSWSRINVPLSIKASYYFDIFREPENYVVVQTKSENIGTYAVRLKEIIDTITQKTGRPKVMLIAHSMGGLVARRYIQLFGNGNVDKLVLIAVPNKGIVGDIADYCTVVGEKLECRDMNADSLFMNKLSSGSLPGIPTFNIIGTGCEMGGGIGDGIVLEKNAQLQGTTNYLINGTCMKLATLHTKILDIGQYPEVYSIIQKALKS